MVPTSSQPSLTIESVAISPNQCRIDEPIQLVLQVKSPSDIDVVIKASLVLDISIV